MATNHTTNYQLNLWEPTDKFSREEVNENTQKLETALTALETGKADASAVTAALAQKADAETVSAALAKKGVCRFEIGTYVGSGTYGKNAPSSLTFSAKPMMLFIGWTVFMFRGQKETYNRSVNGEMAVSWGDRSVQWYSIYNANGQSNSENRTYHYIAFLSCED